MQLSSATTAFPVPRLVAAERAAALRALSPRWAFEPAAAAAAEGLRRRLLFRDFAACFAFMTRVAALSEAQAHHPEWSNVYNRLDMRLTTHDAGGLSAKDVRLARAIDALADEAAGKQELLQ